VADDEANIVLCRKVVLISFAWTLVTAFRLRAVLLNRKLTALATVPTIASE
jgi:hypothetical protein